MAESPRARLWIGRLSWLAVTAVLIFLQLLPLDTQPRRWPAPDVILVVTLVWVARRPEYVPAALIAGVFLLTDMLFQRPPGLLAGLVLILTEMVRARVSSLRNVPFPLEWATIAFGIAAVIVANRVALALTMTPQPPLPMTLIQLLLTCLVYPLVVAVAYLVFGISRPAPGEVDALGQRV